VATINPVLLQTFRERKAADGGGSGAVALWKKKGVEKKGKVRAGMGGGKSNLVAFSENKTEKNIKEKSSIGLAER